MVHRREQGFLSLQVWSWGCLSGGLWQMITAVRMKSTGRWEFTSFIHKNATAPEKSNIRLSTELAIWFQWFVAWMELTFHLSIVMNSTHSEGLLSSVFYLCTYPHGSHEMCLMYITFFLIAYEISTCLNSIIPWNMRVRKLRENTTQSHI